jgi:aminoglycoside phosphotransferase family enzyme
VSRVGGHHGVGPAHPPARPSAGAVTRGTGDSSLIDRSRAQLDRRVRCGFVRDGHGDLRAEHVLLTRPPAIVDCIEFDAARRMIDVGADLARLKVDLVARGKPEMGDELVAAYRSAGGDPGDDCLLDSQCQAGLRCARLG